MICKVILTGKACRCNEQINCTSELSDNTVATEMPCNSICYNTIHTVEKS